MTNEDFHARLSVLEDKMETLEPMLLRLDKFLTRVEGAGLLTKIIFYSLAPIVLAGYWIKDHIKW
jgi:hypothetical protein